MAYADLNAPRPVTPETRFRVQSLTKSVTAWGVLHLVEQGVISLDDPVTQHVTTWEFPETAYDWDDVTIRRLLSHSAGLPSGGHAKVSPIDDMPPLHQALAGDAENPAANPIDAPGSLFRYSNIGYVLLELLIEEVTGQEFAAYMAQEILGPLNMERATFIWSDDVPATVVANHRATGDPLPLYRPSADAREAPNAHGSLYATASDMARFLASGMPGPDGEPAGRDVLSAASVNEIYTPVAETTGFYGLGSEAAALGHFVETLAEGQRAVLNGGQGPGSYNWFHSVPATGDGIVILTNSERSLQFIADVVGMWTAWRDLPLIALSRAPRWMRAPLGVLGALALALAGWLVWDLVTGKLTFAPFAPPARLRRVLLGGFGVLILGLWCGIGYETVRYFLPVFSGWLGIVLSAVAGMLTLTSLFPPVESPCLVYHPMLRPAIENR